jgi:hypothetical protein
MRANHRAVAKARLRVLVRHPSLTSFAVFEGKLAAAEAMAVLVAQSGSSHNGLTTTEAVCIL